SRRCRHDAGRAIDIHALRGKECLPEAVRYRARSSTRAGNVNRMFGRGIIKLCFCRPPGLRKLRMVPAADTRDEIAWRDLFGALRDGFLKFRDRKSPLNPACLM